MLFRSLREISQALLVRYSRRTCGGGQRVVSNNLKPPVYSSSSRTALSLATTFFSRKSSLACFVAPPLKMRSTTLGSHFVTPLARRWDTGDAKPHLRRGRGSYAREIHNHQFSHAQVIRTPHQSYRSRPCPAQPPMPPRFALRHPARLMLSPASCSAKSEKNMVKTEKYLRDCNCINPQC